MTITLKIIKAIVKIVKQFLAYFVLFYAEFIGCAHIFHSHHFSQAVLLWHIHISPAIISEKERKKNGTGWRTNEKSECSQIEKLGSGQQQLFSFVQYYMHSSAFDHSERNESLKYRIMKLVHILHT